MKTKLITLDNQNYAYRVYAKYNDQELTHSTWTNKNKAIEILQILRENNNSADIQEIKLNHGENLCVIL